MATGAGLTVRVLTLDQKSFFVAVPRTASVGALKAAISRQVALDPGAQRLLFRGRFVAGAR